MKQFLPFPSLFLNVLEEVVHAHHDARTQNGRGLVCVHVCWVQKTLVAFHINTFKRLLLFFAPVKRRDFLHIVFIGNVMEPVVPLRPYVAYTVCHRCINFPYKRKSG